MQPELERAFGFVGDFGGPVSGPHCGPHLGPAVMHFILSGPETRTAMRPRKRPREKERHKLREVTFRRKLTQARAGSATGFRLLEVEQFPASVRGRGEAVAVHQHGRNRSQTVPKCAERLGRRRPPRTEGVAPRRTRGLVGRSAFHSDSCVVFMRQRVGAAIASSSFPEQRAHSVQV